MRLELSNNLYSDIFLQNKRNTDDTYCAGIAFGIDDFKGTVWTPGELPGKPDCSSTTNNGDIIPNYNNNYNNYDYNVMNNVYQQLLNYLIIAIGIGLLLFVSNSCLITFMIRNKNKYNNYGKVKQYDCEA